LHFLDNLVDPITVFYDFPIGQSAVFQNSNEETFTSQKRFGENGYLSVFSDIVGKCSAKTFEKRSRFFQYYTLFRKMRYAKCESFKGCHPSPEGWHPFLTLVRLERVMNLKIEFCIIATGVAIIRLKLLL